MIIKMANENELKADFCIEIDFDKESENPSRVFKTMSAMIETFEQIDRDLAVSIDSKIETVLILEDVESGSIKTWFANKIKTLDDESLKSGDVRKIIGSYLVRAKYFVINKLEGKTKITDQKEIDEIQEGLLELAQLTNIRQLPAYIPIEKTKLLNGINNITNALSYLSPKDKASYMTDDNKASFNIDFRYVPEDIEELITKESSTNELSMIVRVKKPDYLGYSMWDFSHGNHSICAKLVDNDWLKDFHNRKYDIRPGDSLKVKMKIISNYDYDNNLISTKYQVLKVFEILKPPTSDQLDVFEKE